jgi:hypothetical protein
LKLMMALKSLVLVVLGPLRCQGQEKRVSVTLRPTEGEYGELSMTVVATLTPKVAKVGTHWRLPATM